MLRPYLRQINRDRRRILFAGGMTLGAGHFGWGLLPDPLTPLPSELIVVALLLTAIPYLSYRFRAQRHWIEIVALANFVGTLIGHVRPTGLFGWHDPLFMAGFQLPAYLGLVFGLRLLIYGRWSDAVTTRRRFVARSTLHSHLPVADLWYGLVPTPGHVDRNPDPEVVSIEYADATRRSVRMITWLPPSRTVGEIRITFDAIQPMTLARFRAEVTQGPRDASAEGATEIRIEDRGRDRRIRIRHRVNGFTPRRVIRGFLDDTLGRMMEARLAAIEAGAAGQTNVKSDARLDSWFNAEDMQPGRMPDRRRGDRIADRRDRPDDASPTRHALGRA